MAKRGLTVGVVPVSLESRQLAETGLSAVLSPSSADSDAEASRSSFILPLFAVTLFLGSFLLFVVEPMVARMVLPVLGGVPMVWNTMSCGRFSP